ncbi:cyclin-dependent kinase 5 activator 1-like [Hydra vulgaris]|uniref:Cyclin-dependent kinase 5 activator 1-like n=1 Tax=Hydra vulgaris TaxID=6087 RepID=A0ABM4CUC6_HYDVU
MGAILTNPVRDLKNDIKITNNNNIPEEKKNNAPFGKFHIVQECFPSLTGKENKFFSEKVPSYWNKAKVDSKKKNKNKELWTLQNKESVKESINSTYIDVRTQEIKIKLNISTEKHFYGILNLSETLKYIGCYIYLRCRNIDGLKPSIVVGWVRDVDKSLILSGWQEMGFVSQPNMIVLYMLLREVIPPKVRSIHQLKAIMMSTLYICYSYNGHEISYPLKPFLLDGDRSGFWTRCIEIINLHSSKLLQVNKDAKYYNDVQAELKTFGRSLERKEN